LFDWPYDASSTLLIQGRGYWLAIIGLVISVVGFAITLIQLDRTKKATKAVADEIDKIQFAVSRYNAVAETSRAETSLDAARRHVRGSEWDLALQSLEAFSKALHTLRELRVREIEPHDANLQQAIVHINRLCERLDGAEAKGLPKNETPKTLSALRDHDMLITSVRVVLDRSNISE